MLHPCFGRSRLHLSHYTTPQYTQIMLESKGRTPPRACARRKDILRVRRTNGAAAMVDQVRQHMTSPPITVVPYTEISDAANLMLSKKIHRLPVVNIEGTLVGCAPNPASCYSGCHFSSACCCGHFNARALLAVLHTQCLLRVEAVTRQWPHRR